MIRILAAHLSSVNNGIQGLMPQAAGFLLRRSPWRPGWYHSFQSHKSHHTRNAMGHNVPFARGNTANTVSTAKGKAK